ncbi:MAG TPA: ribosome maturation factor RimM [Acidimicrobiales bacterium]|nr:ribosome maturation factor RimM [Acidimicrobiales bacterium]
MGALLEIGAVGRPHGLRGDVVVHLVSNRQDRLAPGSQVMCAGRPMVVTRANPLPGKSTVHGSQWVTHFEGVEDRTAAERLSGSLLEAEPSPQEEGLWVHELIGCNVVELDGTERGSVVAVEANPASDLLVLSSGSLVPLHFVVSSEPGVVRVDTPAGLFDL